MRSDLVRTNDRRSRECGNGDPPCQYAPSPDADNPLGLCDGCLEAQRVRLGHPSPPRCPACDPILVLVAGRLVPIAGSMCFSCGLATGGTVASAQHRHEARARMIGRIAVLLAAGDRGPEWTALLARCPADVRGRAERRVAEVPPAEIDAPR